jgi:hypothetical protein
MKRDDLISLIHRELLNAPLQFEKVAGVGAERMPEYWVVCHLMRAVAAAGLHAVPEVAADWQFSHFQSGGKEIPSGTIPEIARARIDLVVCEHADAADRLHARLFMELKGSQSTWAAFGKDIARLRLLSDLLGDGDQAVVLAYVTAPLTVDEQKLDLQAFLKATNLQQSEVYVLSNPPVNADTATRSSYAYTYIIER